MCGFVWMILDKKCRWGCAACPAGATCAGDLYQPVADPGYWIDRSAAAVKGPQTLQSISFFWIF
jgi:hypothetical protein